MGVWRLTASSSPLTPVRLSRIVRQGMGSCRSRRAMPEHDPPRSDRMTVYMRRRATELGPPGPPERRCLVEIDRREIIGLYRATFGALIRDARVHEIRQRIAAAPAGQRRGASGRQRAIAFE